MCALRVTKTSTAEGLQLPRALPPATNMPARRAAMGRMTSSTGCSQLKQMKFAHLDDAPVVGHLAVDLCLHISQLCVDSCTETEVTGDHQSHELQAAAKKSPGCLDKAADGGCVARIS